MRSSFPFGARRRTAGTRCCRLAVALGGVVRLLAACGSGPMIIPLTTVSVTGRSLPNASRATCASLTAADVQGLMSAIIAGSRVASAGSDADGQRCTFTDANATQDVVIVVVPDSDPAAGYPAARAAVSDPVQVDSVGDRAFRERHTYTVTAEHGGVTCRVDIATSDQLPRASAATVATAAGPPAALDDVHDDLAARALGTVCNRLFGVGPTRPDLSGLPNG